MPKQYVINDNSVYEQIENDLFTSYKEIELPKVEELSAEWHGAKIPWKMWQEIMAFMKASQAKFSSETMLFLYYDEKAKQPWSYWVPPQETSGMTVKSSPDDSEFAKQRAAYPDIMFGTVHHHCTSSAFQSGTDEADETTREGFHFTVGCLGKDQDSEVHARLTLGAMHYEFENLDLIIETNVNPFKKNVVLDDNMQDFVTQYRNRLISKVPDDWEQRDFSKEFKNVHNRTFAWKSKHNKNYFGATNSGRQIGFGWDDKWDKELYPVKKTEDAFQIEDVTDELITQLSFDHRFDDILYSYATQYKSKDHEYITQLGYGILSDEELATALHAMLCNEIFMQSNDGDYLQETIKDFLDEYKVLGQTFTQEQIRQHLETYEDRSSIQSVD